MTTWILSWDDIGLEAVINWTEMQRNDVLETLKNNTSARAYEIINVLQLRARFNTQRNPEIYAINMEDSLTEKEIRDTFQDGGDAIKELIRRKAHYKIF